PGWGAGNFTTILFVLKIMCAINLLLYTFVAGTPIRGCKTLTLITQGCAAFTLGYLPTPSSEGVFKDLYIIESKLNI
ncbi:MAG TPA: hypothetical protein VGP47_10255, partial [Parachlamydiaceae bacterium]|nr:hypothetical protein [Parachlamydiaceae bacterium]